MQVGRHAFVDSIRYLLAADRRVVERAVARAVQWHGPQKRESGEPYATHPIAVAQYLAGLEADRDTLIAALLHDVIEDHHADADTIRAEFGDTVSKLVESVTKLSLLRYEGDRTARQVASLRKMLLVASEDLRVILIKLADRWHNIETIASLAEDKQLRVAKETLDIYVPFARIMGLWDLKRRCEEICFPIACPEESAQWHAAVASARSALQPAREAFIRRINAETGKNITPQLMPMTDFELFQKFYGDLQRLEEAHNVDSVLIVISESVQPLDCYQLLGAIHLRYPVRSVLFRDYINAPLPNGYRGLHTTIFLARNHELRLRIQTQEMYEYVTKRKISTWIMDKDSDIHRSLSSLHHVAFDSAQYLSDLKQNVLERMSVFTTGGEIVRVPRGATGVDFAFALNPDMAMSMAGIRVNGELREATYELHDGDTVELVLLEKGEQEQRWRLWLETAKSADARESMKGELRRHPQEQQRQEGRNLLEFEARKRKLPLWPLFRWSHTQQRLASDFGVTSFDELLEQVGRGEFSVKQAIDAYRRILLQSPSLLHKILKFFRLLPRSRVLNKEADVIDLEIYAEDRQGLIFDITRRIVERKINIAKFSVFAIPPKDALYQMRLEVPHFEEFSKLFDALLQVPSVKTIIRKR